MSPLFEYTLPSGSLVHVDGIPYALKGEAIVMGNNEPKPVVTPDNEHSQTEGGSPIEKTIGQEAQAKGPTAPRITPADIEANIVGEYFFTADDALAGHDGSIPEHYEHLSLLIFCVLVLKNGFTVTGESACVSPENFDAKIGRGIARKKAVEKVWPLMGYELQSMRNNLTKAQVFADADDNAVSMPLPVAYRGKGQPYLFSLSPRSSESDLWEGLITTDQAELYAEARVREALEVAVKICDEQAKEWDSDSQITDKNYAEHCAEHIRGLVK